MNYQEILDLPVEHPDDCDSKISIREFYKLLLVRLFQEQEGFSGKRPFGNSGWVYPVYATLIENNVVEGTLDEYGDVEECDDRVVDTLLLKLIDEL